MESLKIKSHGEWVSNPFWSFPKLVESFRSTYNLYDISPCIVLAIANSLKTANCAYASAAFLIFPVSFSLEHIELRPVFNIILLTHSLLLVAYKLRSVHRIVQLENICRTMTLIACGCTTVGAGIKVFAWDRSGFKGLLKITFLRSSLDWYSSNHENRNYFWLLMIGQFISQLTWSFINVLSGRLANKWFKVMFLKSFWIRRKEIKLKQSKKTEISRATAIGACGIYVGNGLGYILPPTIITDPVKRDQGIEVRDQSSDWTIDDYELVKSKLIWLHSISFAVAAVIFIGIFIVYDKEPHGAPNKCRMINKYMNRYLIRIILVIFPDTIQRQKLSELAKLMNKTGR